MYRRLVYSCRGFELVITLVGCESFPRLVTKLPIDVSGVIALVLERFLNIYNYFIRRQIVVGKGITTPRLATAWLGWARRGSQLGAGNRQRDEFV